jgi:hypothetical protein
LSPAAFVAAAEGDDVALLERQLQLVVERAEVRQGLRAATGQRHDTTNDTTHTTVHT